MQINRRCTHLWKIVIWKLVKLQWATLWLSSRRGLKLLQDNLRRLIDSSHGTFVDWQNRGVKLRRVDVRPHFVTRGGNIHVGWVRLKWGLLVSGHLFRREGAVWVILMYEVAVVAAVGSENDREKGYGADGLVSEHELWVRWQVAAYHSDGWNYLSSGWLGQ